MRKLQKGTGLAIVLLFLMISGAQDISALSSTLQITNISDEYDPVKTIVIDPGHGGKDSGTRGKKTLEKDIALEIALRLGQLLQVEYPKIKVIFTRTSDKFVPLFERTAIANRNHADLFVSIHCNASRRKEANGTETFVMGLHKSAENLEIAKRENQAVLLEDDYKENYGGFDPNSPEAHIILSAYQNQNLENSIALAELMQSEMSRGGIKVSRGVKQAGFVVLRTATMPSILIETGFLSNQQDEAYLATREGRYSVASSIFIGIEKFIEIQNQKAMQKPTVSAYEKHMQSKSKTNVYHSPVQTTVSKKVTAPEQKKAKSLDPSTRYTVQIAATSSRVDLAHRLNMEDLNYWLIYDKGMFKYMSGNFEDLPSAYAHREKLLAEGFKGAFLFKYKLGEKTILEN